MTEFDDNLALAIDLSNRIIALGSEGQWDRVRELDQQRLRLLQRLFADKATLEARREELKAQLERLLDLNEQAAAICAQARTDCMASSRAAKRGLRAISAYHKQSGGR